MRLQAVKYLIKECNRAMEYKLKLISAFQTDSVILFILFWLSYCLIFH